MPYSAFTFQDVRDKLSLQLRQDVSLFTHIDATSLSASFETTLRDNVALALNINTEKARSEMIIVPVLLEVWKLLHRQISLFSGIEFAVDPALGLTGVCDYLLSQSPNQVYVSAPVVVIVEAKNENIKAGLPQCIATMYAAHLFNAREHNAIERILGIVTTGSNWKFLLLDQSEVVIDYDEYFIDQAGKIVTILLQACTPALPLATALSTAED